MYWRLWRLQAFGVVDRGLMWQLASAADFLLGIPLSQL